MFCSHCGAGLPDRAALCPACGRTAPTGVLVLDADATRIGAPSDTATMLSMSGVTGIATTPSAGTRGGTPLTGGTGAAFGPSGTLAPGSAFGTRYHLIRLLGVGGMGAVYQAWDDALGVSVALKVIRPEITADPAMARDLEKRFKRELLLARQVTHKNVVRIHDLGEVDGIKYLTMPYIQGGDLATILKKEGKLPVARAVSIARQVVGGMCAAHEAGVIHRDLKPANIMIDEDDQAVIMDFGISRSISGGGATVAGAVVGTLEYMAPEQAMAQPVDHRGDIYSIGLIIYDMVLGPRHATRAESAIAELMSRVQKPLAPARSIDPAIPEALERIIDRCTQPEPAARYQLTSQLVQDLELLDGAGRHTASTTGTLSAPPITRTIPPVAPAPPRAVQVKVVVAAAAIVVALTGATWLLRDRFMASRELAGAATGRPLALAVLPFRNATGDEKLDWLGPSLADMVTGDVGQSSRLRLVAAERVFQLLRDLHVGANTALDADTIRRVGDFTSADAVVSGRFVKLGDQIRIEAVMSGAHTDPIQLPASTATESDLLKSAQELAGAIQRSLSLGTSAISELQASAFRPSSKSVQAIRFYSEGLQASRAGEQRQAAQRFSEATKADPQFALAFARLGESYAQLGQSAEAEQAASQALGLSQNLPAEEKEIVSGVHARIVNDIDKAIESYERLVKARPTDGQLRFELAGLLENKGLLDRARDEYAAVLAADSKYVDALLASGRVAIRRGDYQGSIEPLTQALTLSVTLDNREAKGKVLQALGIAYRSLNKLEDALKMYQESIEIKRAIGDKRGIAASLSEIAQVHNLQGHPEEAVASYKESIAIRQAIGDRRGLGIALISLGAAYLDSGRYAESLDSFKESLQIQRDLGDEERQARCLSNIGNVYYAQAQYDDARTYLERALELREKSKVAGSIALTLTSLGDVSVKLGDYTRAETQYLRAMDLWRSAGDKRGAAIGSFGMGGLLEQQGRYGAALEAKGEALKTFRTLQERSYLLAQFLIGYGSTLAQAGRVDEADKNLVEGLAIARELKNQPLIAETFNAQGESAYYRGDPKGARALFEQARQAASRTGDRYFGLVASMNLARVSAEEGRPDSAVGELKRVMREADSLGLKHVSAEAELHLGAALLSARKAGEARAELTGALMKAEKLRSRALLARVHYLLAEALQQTGAASDASTHLTQARELVAEIQKEPGTQSLLARSDLKGIPQVARR
jgi:tetratricopeptide (TPR) repeat protein